VLRSCLRLLLLLLLLLLLQDAIDHLNWAFVFAS
jgi:hypothetical protein